MMIFNMSHSSWTREFVLHNRVYPWMSFTSCFSLLLIILYCALVLSALFLLLFLQALVVVRMAPPHLSFSVEVCVCQLLWGKWNVLLAWYYWNFKALPFKCFSPTGGGLLRITFLPTVQTSVNAQAQQLWQFPPSQKLQKSNTGAGLQLFTPGGREVFQSFACCFEFLVLGVVCLFSFFFVLILEGEEERRIDRNTLIH